METFREKKSSQDGNMKSDVGVMQNAQATATLSMFVPLPLFVSTRKNSKIHSTLDKRFCVVEP